MQKFEFPPNSRSIGGLPLWIAPRSGGPTTKAAHLAPKPVKKKVGSTQPHRGLSPSRRKPTLHDKHSTAGIATRYQHRTTKCNNFRSSHSATVKRDSGYERLITEPPTSCSQASPSPSSYYGALPRSWRDGGEYRSGRSLHCNTRAGETARLWRMIPPPQSIISIISIKITRFIDKSLSYLPFLTPHGTCHYQVQNTFID